MGVIGTLKDFIFRENRSGFDYKNTFEKYCNLIDKSNFLSNAYYESISNGSNTNINYYSKKIEAISKKIDNMEASFPWLINQYNSGVGVNIIKQYPNTRKQGLRWKLEDLGEKINRGIFKV